MTGYTRGGGFDCRDGLGKPAVVLHHLWIYVDCGGGTDSVDRDLVTGPDQADGFVDERKA
jgi:hypothetical protein